MEIDFSIRIEGKKKRRVCFFGGKALGKKLKRTFIGEKFGNKLKNVNRINEKCCQSRFLAPSECRRAKGNKLSDKVSFPRSLTPMNPVDTNVRASGGNSHKKI